MIWIITLLSLLLAIVTAAWLSERGYRRRFRYAQKVAAQLLGEHGPQISEALHRAGGHDLLDDLELLRAKQNQLIRRIESEEFNLHTILRGMVEALMVVDTKRVIKLVNPQFVEFFRLPESPINRTILETIRLPEMEMMVRETIRSGEPQREEIVLTRQGETGARRTFEVNSVATRDQTGAVDGAVIILHDITQLKQLEEVRRDFVANVSHELRTPLSIFRGYLETLLDNPKQPPKELLRVLYIMEKHSMRLHALVEDLLSLARLESRAPSLELATVALQPFLEQLVADWKLKLEARNLQTTVRVEPATVCLLADEGRLEEVLHNLLDNAVKYSDEGSRIVLSGEQLDGHVVLSVTDAGKGIPPADLPHIFERFYRVEKARTREHGGTGLGLSIVKHIVQLHGGSVAAESAVGCGTTIKIAFPQTLDADGPEVARREVALSA